MKIYFLALLLIPNLLIAEPCKMVEISGNNYKIGEEQYTRCNEEIGICITQNQRRNDYYYENDYGYICAQDCKNSVYFNNYDGLGEKPNYKGDIYLIYYFCDGINFVRKSLDLICDNFKFKYENPYNKEAIKNIKKYCSQFDSLANGYGDYNQGLVKISDKIFMSVHNPKYREYEYLINKFNDANIKYENSLKEPIKISTINLLQYISLGLSSFIMILILFLFRNIKKIKKQK